MGQPSPTQPPRRGPRIVFLVLAVVLALGIAGGSGLAIATIRHVEGSITKLPVEPQTSPGQSPSPCTDCLPITPCVRKVCNYLLLGSDSRKGLPSQYGNTKNSPGQRSDTIILVHS